MSTDPAQMQSHSPLTPAERMRAYRRRRREGSFFVRVQLDQPEIDGLVRVRHLRPGQRQDTEALQVAVRGLIYEVLEGCDRGLPLGCSVTVTRTGYLI